MEPYSEQAPRWALPAAGGGCLAMAGAMRGRLLFPQSKDAEWPPPPPLRALAAALNCCAASDCAPACLSSFAAAALTLPASEGTAAAEACLSAMGAALQSLAFHATAAAARQTADGEAAVAAADECESFGLALLFGDAAPQRASAPCSRPDPQSGEAARACVLAASRAMRCACAADAAHFQEAHADALRELHSRARRTARGDDAAADCAAAAASCVACAQGMSLPLRARLAAADLLHGEGVGCDASSLGARLLLQELKASAAAGTDNPLSTALWGALLEASAAGAPLPVVVFSHGLGGSRSLYSLICGELASQGYVVLAIEHADGTACAAKLAGGHGWR